MTDFVDTNSTPDGASRDAAEIVEPDVHTLRARVLAALEKAGPRGLTTSQLPAIGGTEATRRVRELSAHHPIDRYPVGGGSHEWRYVLLHKYTPNLFP